MPTNPHTPRATGVLALGFTLAGLLASCTSGESLEAWAFDHYAAIAADRKEGCGANYAINGEPPSRTVVAGRQGIRAAFTGGTPSKPTASAPG